MTDHVGVVYNENKKGLSCLMRSQIVTPLDCVIETSLDCKIEKP